MNSWFLHNGRLLTREGFKLWPILVLEGKIAAIGPEAQVRRREIPGCGLVDLDLQGKVICRGFVDLHTHLRQPGYASKETVATGTKAAARGGYAQLFAMPNTDPPLDSFAALQNFREICRTSAAVKVIPIAALSVGRRGREPVDYARFVSHGIRFFTDDGSPAAEPILTEALRTLALHGGTVINHLEEPAYVSAGWDEQAIPAESEFYMLERDLELVRKYRCHYHAAHLSCRQSVELIAQAKAEGLPVTAEVTPHHLTLNRGDITYPQGNYQMKPPLRSSEDQQALIAGLRSGIIDVIATDHAPHGREKEGPFHLRMPFGVTGLETAFAILHTELILKERLSLEDLLLSLSARPAELANLPSFLSEGQPADITVLDLEKELEVASEQFLSRGTNNPFIGRTLRGWPVLTLVDGEVKHSCLVRE